MIINRRLSPINGFAVFYVNALDVDTKAKVGLARTYCCYLVTAGIGVSFRSTCTAYHTHWSGVYIYCTHHFYHIRDKLVNSFSWMTHARLQIQRLKCTTDSISRFNLFHGALPLTGSEYMLHGREGEKCPDLGYFHFLAQNDDQWLLYGRMLFLRRDSGRTLTVSKQ